MADAIRRFPLRSAYLVPFGGFVAYTAWLRHMGLYSRVGAGAWHFGQFIPLFFALYPKSKIIRGGNRFEVTKGR